MRSDSITSTILHHRIRGASILSGLLLSFGGNYLVTPMPVQARETYSKSVVTGIEYYDYETGDGDGAKIGDKVSIRYKGRLAGRQGWVYDDTFNEVGV